MARHGRTDLLFSAMTRADLREVLQLDGENPSGWSISHFERHLRGRYNLAWVARFKKAETIAAFFCGQYLLGELEIHKIVVGRQWRRQGIATALLGFVLAAHPDAVVFLELRAANSAARNLYETLGFSNCGHRKKYYSSPVDDAIIMKLS